MLQFENRAPIFVASHDSHTEKIAPMERQTDRPFALGTEGVDDGLLPSTPRDWCQFEGHSHVIGAANSPSSIEIACVVKNQHVRFPSIRPRKAMKYLLAP